MLGLLREPQLPDFLTSLVEASFREKLGVLDAVELSDRYRLALSLLRRHISVRAAGGSDQGRGSLKIDSGFAGTEGIRKLFRAKEGWR